MRMANQFCPRIVLLGVSLYCFLSGSSVQAETYIAGQIGLTIPQDLSNVNFGGPGFGRGPDFELTKSFMYGAKLGHYFDNLKWLGVETEIFRNSMRIKQQPFAGAAGGTGGIEPGADLGVTVWAANLVARYQMGRLQPYAGVGPAFFFARVKSESPNSTFGEGQSTTLGLNTQLGLRYMLNEHVALFGEWKYNHARLSFDSIPNATYNVHHLVLGVGYHF